MRRLTVTSYELHQPLIKMWVAAAGAPEPDERVQCETEDGWKREGRVCMWQVDGRRPQELHIAIAMEGHGA